MGLLLESKRMWLLSYMICVSISVALYYFLWDHSIARTTGIMFFTIQSIMFVFFWLIIFFRWKLYCRIVVTIIYLGMTIYEGLNGYLTKWYIIIPVFLVTVIYMMWNLGGIINCAIASPYRDRINGKVIEGRYSYDLYAGDIDGYNKRNGLVFFTKIRKKKEPNWKRLGFNYSALEMFHLENALVGIDVSQWESKENKLNKINNKLNDKNDALNNNMRIFDEKNSLDMIRAKAKSVGLDTSVYDTSRDKLEILRKKNIKKEKGILKKRL